jgi:signal transduction histidine kinase
MMSNAIRRYTIVLAAWLPFFVIWVFFAMIYARMTLGGALITSAISMGSASLLGIGVWHVCQRWPWPFRLSLGFYLLHILLACAYALTWIITIAALESLHRGKSAFAETLASRTLGWEALMGVWIYGLFAGVSYAVQTRNRLHEKESLAARAEALASAARLDALRARLNPHFLFNALHTLSALVKFRPALAESAIERLGDMLRYALKEDGRELVEFSEEYDFTRQYLAFEQLRYEDRLKVDIQVDPESFNFELPPFSMQTLAENAVHHAISIRPAGGSIWIRCTCHEGKLIVSVRDDGPGDGVDSATSHQFGLRSLRERLSAAYGESAGLQIQNSSQGFEATFEVPSSISPSAATRTVGEGT